MYNFSLNYYLCVLDFFIILIQHDKIENFFTKLIFLIKNELEKKFANKKSFNIRFFFTKILEKL